VWLLRRRLAAAAATAAHPARQRPRGLLMRAPTPPDTKT
jgi:hypothetical protein